MPVPGVDPEAMLAVLVAHGVRFVVIGGYALELWDVAVPPTVDVDVTPETTRPNLTRLAAALDEMDAALRVSGHDPVPVAGGFTPQLLAQMAMINLTTRYGALDVTIRPAGTDGYRDLRLRSAPFTVGSVVVEVADLEDVARSKEAAGRAKDIMVLPAVRDHLRRRR
jgi:hypothetical protein